MCEKRVKNHAVHLESMRNRWSYGADPIPKAFYNFVTNVGQLENPLELRNHLILRYQMVYCTGILLYPLVEGFTQQDRSVWRDGKDLTFLILRKRCLMRRRTSE